MYEIIGKAARQVKILTFDIETRPNLAYTWGLWDQNISLAQLIEPGAVFAFAAKWYHEKRTRFHSDHTDGHADMVLAAWKLLDEADIVVHYNGKNFDVKHLNREFVLAGLTPPSPFKQVDLLQVARSQFKFQSNKLDHVASQLGLGGKTSHTGFQLWIDCMAGDAKAWRLMERYNRQDVKLTEALYDRLRPWIKSHPHIGMWTGKPDACSNCGQDGPHEYTGIYRTLHQAYDRYKCRNCGTAIRTTTKLHDPIKNRQAA
ncbi:ribonuclease H-like domain-containing protein [Cryobacterium sp. SO1]|uniref:ribonuclease H-like domain-containing protein n=1 Tax=Cryobacterium sp. SO1 TaxID=1897061 RepID=UPI0010D28778|nr:ribonuclease H-like domain-containing protein [Cryobacterium sp. SO1]RZI36986.1 hypothetical protein BJQ95_00653 [Cryobacterium sp. SO1]